jgi:hypothetical protein
MEYTTEELRERERKELADAIVVAKLALIPGRATITRLRRKHRRLVQQRINLRRQLGKTKPALTSEQRVAAGQRLREGKRAASGGVRENGIAPRFLVEQIDAKVKGDPDLPRA